jgi:hypothetical protein
MRRAQEASSEILSKAGIEGPTLKAAAANLMLPSDVAKNGGMGVQHPGYAATHLHRGAILPGAEVEAADVDAGGVGKALQQINFHIGRHKLSVRGGATGMLNAHFAVFGDVAWQHQVTSNGFQGWAFNGGFRHDF